jgi:hypothetical protein
MRLRDALEQGCNDFSAGAVEHAWRPSPSPQPRPLPHGERKRWMGAEQWQLCACVLQRCRGHDSPLSCSAGEGLGVRAVRTFPLAPSPHTLGAEEVDGSGAVVILGLHLATMPRPRLTPLLQRGRGAGGEGSPHLPPCPVSSHIGSGRGGWERSSGNSAPASCNDAAATTHPSPAARERGWG